MSSPQITTMLGFFLAWAGTAGAGAGGTTVVAARVSRALRFIPSEQEGLLPGQPVASEVGAAGSLDAMALWGVSRPHAARPYPNPEPNPRANRARNIIRFIA